MYGGVHATFMPAIWVCIEYQCCLILEYDRLKKGVFRGDFVAQPTVTGITSFLAKYRLPRPENYLIFII